MTKKTTRVKSATQSAIYQSRDEVQVAIKIIGDKQRELQRLATAMNDELAAISASYAQHNRYQHYAEKAVKQNAKATIRKLKTIGKLQNYQQKRPLTETGRNNERNFVNVCTINRFRGK